MQQDEQNDGKPSDPAGSGGYALAICAALAFGALVGLAAGYVIPERDADLVAVLETVETTPSAGLEVPLASNRPMPRVLGPASAQAITMPANPLVAAAADIDVSLPGAKAEPALAKPETHICMPVTTRNVQVSRAAKLVPEAISIFLRPFRMRRAVVIGGGVTRSKSSPRRRNKPRSPPTHCVPSSAKAIADRPA